MRNRPVFRHVFALILLCMPVLATHAEVVTPGAKVYLLRMKNGFDLHLANRLTESGLVTVVTEPAEAEYIITESVGRGFEEMMKQLYPPPPEEKASEKEDGDDDSGVSQAPKTINQYAGQRATTFGRSDGTVFFVRRSDSSVTWSTFLERRDTRDAMMHKNAGEVVKRLKKRLEADRKKQLTEAAED